MGMREISVSFMVSDEQIGRLEKLLPAWQKFESEGNRPFQSMTVDELFRRIMFAGSGHTINKKIDQEEHRYKLGALPYRT